MRQVLLLYLNSLVLVPSALIISVAKSNPQNLISSNSLEGNWNWSWRSIRMAQQEFDLELNDPNDRYGILADRIVYTTVNHNQQPTQASGLIRYRSDIHKFSKNGKLRVLSYQHATRLMRKEAPSANPWDPEVLAMMLHFVSKGWLVVFPDYLGLGVHQGHQAYLDHSVQTQTVIDFLWAVDQWITQKDLKWDRSLFIAGYSQGAHTTLALQRELERQAESRLPWRLNASAVLGGPLSLTQGSLPQLIKNRSSSANLFVGLTLVGLSHNPIYQLNPSLILREPYASELPQWFDGERSFDEVAAKMPTQITDFFHPHVFLELQLQQENSPIFKALAQQDLIEGWAPRTPTLLVHSNADTTVHVENSQLAYEKFKQAGSPITYIELEDLKHSEAVIPAFQHTRNFFER